MLAAKRAFGVPLPRCGEGTGVGGGLGAGGRDRFVLHVGCVATVGRFVRETYPHPSSATSLPLLASLPSPQGGGGVPTEGSWVDARHAFGFPSPSAGRGQGWGASSCTKGWCGILSCTKHTPTPAPPRRCRSWLRYPPRKGEGESSMQALQVWCFGAVTARVAVGVRACGASSCRRCAGCGRRPGRRGGIGGTGMSRRRGRRRRARCA